MTQLEPAGALRDRIQRIRLFNRFYTKHIGALREGLLDSELSLPDARLLFEIAHRRTTTGSELADELALDGGYVSRRLQSLETRDLIARTASDRDARQRVIRLTGAGEAAFADLSARTQRQLERMLAGLSAHEQEELVAAMESIETTLGAPPEAERPRAFFTRSHEPGDIGWVTYRHGVLYNREYGWDATFEALVAVILGEFAQRNDPRRERSWIAEVDGRFAGCVFLMKQSDTVARLRCLLVEPSARGIGLGSDLVRQCIAFGRGAGYERITLWTNDVLDAARRIYERAGFTLTKEEPHHSFGHDLVGQTWDLELPSR